MIRLMQLFVYIKQFSAYFPVYNRLEVCYNTLTEFEHRYDDLKQPDNGRKGKARSRGKHAKNAADKPFSAGLLRRFLQRIINEKSVL